MNFFKKAEIREILSEATHMFLFKKIQINAIFDWTRGFEAFPPQNFGLFDVLLWRPKDTAIFCSYIK